MANIFETMPAHGTIVGVLESAELAAFRELSDRYQALQVPGLAINKAEYMDARREYTNWWIKVCEAFKFNYAWPISINYMTGELYIDSK
jgi:hypothetical protein